MRMLITGAKGRLGSQLAALLSPHHEVTATDIDELDFTDRARLRRFMHDLAPQLVVHCGAMTAVDQCALQPEEALRVNGFGTKNVALTCQEMDAALLYISTNEVFDGHHAGFIREYDAPKPINPYGYSKWFGEQVIRDHLTRYYIVRTAWLFAHGGRNFVQTILDRARQGVPLRVVVNEVSSPTYTHDLAQAIVDLLATEQYGIYHLVNEGRASRWAFARKILDLTGYADVEIEKISAAEYPRPSTPPEYSVLLNTAAAALGIRLRHWEAALADFLQREQLVR